VRDNIKVQTWSPPLCPDRGSGYPVEFCAERAGQCRLPVQSVLVVLPGCSGAQRDGHQRRQDGDI
jgi:hypothetical protein